MVKISSYFCTTFCRCCKKRSCSHNVNYSNFRDQAWFVQNCYVSTFDQVFLIQRNSFFAYKAINFEFSSYWRQVSRECEKKGDDSWEFIRSIHPIGPASIWEIIYFFCSSFLLPFFSLFLKLFRICRELKVNILKCIARVYACI